MHPAPELSIVVPTFNERANITLQFEHLSHLLVDCDWEVIFVDDNSPDGTAAVARACVEGQCSLSPACAGAITGRSIAVAMKRYGGGRPSLLARVVGNASAGGSLRRSARWSNVETLKQDQSG